jgi:hypothetical protein
MRLQLVLYIFQWFIYLRTAAALGCIPARIIHGVAREKSPNVPYVINMAEAGSRSRLWSTMTTHGFDFADLIKELVEVLIR